MENKSIDNKNITFVVTNNKFFSSFIILLFITMFGFSCTASAVGIPVIDPGAPIKVSESSSYSCDENDKALYNGTPLHLENKAVTCHDDNLFLNGKSLSFIDIMVHTAKDASTKEPHVPRGG